MQICKLEHIHKDYRMGEIVSPLKDITLTVNGGCITGNEASSGGGIRTNWQNAVRVKNNIVNESRKQNKTNAGKDQTELTGGSEEGRAVDGATDHHVKHCQGFT